MSIADSSKPDRAAVLPASPAAAGAAPWRVILACGALLALLLWGVLAWRNNRTDAGGATTAGAGAANGTATLERRDFVRTVRVHGVVEAVESYAVAAPRLAGPGPGNMLITRLVANCSKIRKGNILVEFDRQNQERNMLDRKAEYLDLEEQIKKKRADLEAARARDDTELKQAENAVATAELEMRKNEVISRIDAEKNAQTLEESKARFAQLKETYQLKRVAARAEIRILEIQRDRARNAMEHALENMEKMQIRSRMDGMAVLVPIWKSGQMGEVQEGDEVNPGNAFLLVVNPASMMVRSKVNQADVPNIRTGLPVTVRLDAYPDLALPGRLERLAAIGITSSMNNKVRTFAIGFLIQGTDPRLLPDLSAAVDVEVQRIPNALVAPLDTLITDAGKTYVQVKRGGGFEKVEVKIAATSDREIVLDGSLEPGTVLARGKT